MKGISAVVAVIMVLMITVALASLAYLWFGGVFGSITEEASGQIERETQGMFSEFKLESVDVNDIYLRNTGGSSLSGFNIYVNNKPVEYIDNFDGILRPGESGKITISPYVGGEGYSTVYIATQQGAKYTGEFEMDLCKKSDVVLCYRFEGSGSTATDGSDNENDGTIYGATRVSGISGNALSFDGSGDYVQSATNTELTSSEFTAEAWVWHDSLVGDQDPIFGNTRWSPEPDGIIEGYSLKYHSNTELRTFVGRSGSGYFLFIDTTPFQQWVYVVLTYDGTTARIYINGEEATSGDGDYTPSTQSAFRVGRDYTNQDRYFNGKIDEFVVHKRVLGPEEISFRYESMMG